MQSLAYLFYNSAVPGASFKSVGDLRFYQREPLAHRGIDTRYNVSKISHKLISHINLNKY